MPARARHVAPTPPQPAQKLRVALYTRVSTDIQASRDEGSLDTQEARLRSALAARAGDYEVCQVFREEGESGKSLDRPALQQLLARVRAREFDLLMVTRIDRLSRSLLDFYEVHRLFEETGVQFVSLNETFDTSTAVGRAMLKLVLVFAELEREQTAERTRLAMRARAERGLWNGGHPPLGYDSAGSGHLVVNTTEAELLREIFAKYEESRSSVAVYRWLNDNGHRQKVFTSRRRGASGGKKFTVSTIQTLLTNRLYLGEIDHKGDIFAGQHEALIDRDTFDRVQKIIETNDKGAHGPPLRAQYEYLLTGVLRCACGHALTTSAGNGKGGRYHYYRCVGVMKKPDHVCSVRQVRAEPTDAVVLDTLRDAARDPRLLERAVEEANTQLREEVDPVRKRVEQLRRELTDAEDTAARTLAQILSAGIMASPTAKRVLAECEERQNQLKTALAQAEGELTARQNRQLDQQLVINAVRGFALCFDELPLAERRALMQLLVDRVELHPDHVIVALRAGEKATRYLQTNKTVLALAAREASAEHESGAQNDETPDSRPGFVSVSEWLPLPDLNRGPSD